MSLKGLISMLQMHKQWPQPKVYGPESFAKSTEPTLDLITTSGDQMRLLSRDQSDQSDSSGRCEGRSHRAIMPSIVNYAIPVLKELERSPVQTHKTGNHWNLVEASERATFSEDD